MSYLAENLVLVSDLKAAGMSPRDVARRVAPLERVAVGAYLLPADRTGEQAHLARAAGALSRVQDAVTSHTTAAISRGLPVLSSHLEQVQLSPISGRRGNPKQGPGYWLHCRPVPESEISTHLGVPATDPLRTVVDCARLLDSDWGVAIADAALHRGLVAPEALVARCAGVTRVKGAARVRQLPELASPLAESPGESLLRMRLLRMGLEVAEQVVLHDVVGEPRVDFVVAGRLVVEFDGESKYAMNGDVPRAHWLEKQRHDRIVETGYGAIHVVWAQLWDEPALRFRVNRALVRLGQLP